MLDGADAHHRRHLARPRAPVAHGRRDPADQRPRARGAVRHPGARRAAPARRALPRSVLRHRRGRPRGRLARRGRGPADRRRSGQRSGWPRPTSSASARPPTSACCQRDATRLGAARGDLRSRVPRSALSLRPGAGRARRPQARLARARRADRGRARRQGAARACRRATRSSRSAATAQRGSCCCATAETRRPPQCAPIGSDSTWVGAPRRSGDRRYSA